MNNYFPPFTITNEMISLISSIMEKVGKVDSYSNLSKYPVLRKQNRIKSIHSSCAIEANSLSFEQVTSVINGAKVIGPQKDIIEVQNAVDAYNQIEKVNPLEEGQIKTIHYLFGKNIIRDAGKYRTINEGVSDEQGNVVFVAPPPSMVPSLMNNLFSWMNKESNSINPLILSSIFHYEFVFIHPFSDGNGRTARFWQNALLGKWKSIFYWLPIENQIHKYQSEYYNAISKSHSDGNSNAFIVFMLGVIDKTFNELISDAKQLDHSISIYLEKLLNVLKTGIWYTSNQILDSLDLKSKETLRKNYINPAVENGLMILEFPDKPTSKNQRYKIIRK
ncbi:MAG: Fic family protein [Erysipelotrichaceae bacterium]|nr:Fic family protein [Erysipelotrichaceae bacterium]